MPGMTNRSPAAPQPVAAPLTRTAIFLVVTVSAGAAAETAVRTLCGDSAGLLRAVGFREPDGGLSCIMAFGSDVWDRLFGAPRPAELHPFREIRAGARHAVATPGDLLFHIRAERMDLCFELATQIMTRLGGAVSPADEVHGFRYFDDRDLLGFVDGTENPSGAGGDRGHADRRRGRRLRRRQLCHRAEVPARYRRLERAAHRGAGTHHRPHQAVRHRARRRGQADLRAQRADHDRGERQGDQDPARQHAVRPGRARANSAPISSATAARRAPSSRCWTTCSSAARRAITTACSISAAPSPAIFSSCRTATFLDDVTPDARKPRRRRQSADEPRSRRA